MNYGIPEGSDKTMPKEKERQLLFLGMGFYGAIFMINVVVFYSYQSSKPHIAVLRILAPVLTVALTISDTWFLRRICRKQFPTNPELLEKWPINVPSYPTWLYYVYLVLSFAISGYLLSRL